MNPKKASMNSRSVSVLILGAGGHASVVLDALLAGGIYPMGIIDPLKHPGETWEGIPVLGDDDYVLSMPPEAIVLVNGVGAVPGTSLRNDLFRRFRAQGYSFLSLVHPSAVLSPAANLEEGSQVMAGSVLQRNASVGENSVVNTRAVLEHDCSVEAGSFIGPGAILCGNTRVKEGAFIGAGAVLLPGVIVGQKSVVGAGAVVLRDVEKEETVTGVPAKPREK